MTNIRRSDNPEKDRLWQHVGAACNGTLTGPDRDELERLVQSDPELKRLCVAYFRLHADLQWRFRGGAETAPVPAAFADGTFADEMNVRQDVLSEAASGIIFSGTAACQRPVDRQVTRPSSVQVPKRWHRDAGLSLAFLVLGIAMAWMGMWLVGGEEPPMHLAQDPVSAPPATVTPAAGEWVARLVQSTSDATWGEGSGPNEFLLRLRSGQTMKLLSGFAEVEFVSGAVVILHGPSEFTPTGPDSAVLGHGRVTGRCENGNFRLLTPSAQVIDLGTEFGVAVDDASNTQVVVFEGEVSVAPNDSPPKRVEAIFLDGGATARIDASGELATGISVEWERFKRAIPRPPSTMDELLDANRLSLIDIVNGGDGRGRTLAGAIDPLTGTWDQRPWQLEHGPGRLHSDGGYHLSASHSLLDGVFIPARRGKETRITSSGHRVDFPANLGSTWGPIWARRRGDGALPSPIGDFWGAGTLPFILRRVEAARVGAIGMHANVGMTFNLHNLSEPFRSRVQSLEATLVNLDLAEETDRDGLRRAPVRTADFWVLVDGELKFSRRNFGRDLEGQPLKVDISSRDRFLTLVSTDAGNSISFDHVMLIDPILTLRQSDPPSREKDKEN